MALKQLTMMIRDDQNNSLASRAVDNLKRDEIDQILCGNTEPIQEL